MDGHHPVFRTARGSKLSAAEGQDVVAFEAGAHDERIRSGWSVVVNGRAYATGRIGAITLKWNQIEAHIDFIGSHILFTKNAVLVANSDEQSAKHEGQTSSSERVPQTLDPHGR